MGDEKYVLVLLLAGLFVFSHLQGAVEGKLDMMRKQGDSIFGSIERICVPTASSSCGDFDINGLLKVEAIIYAVESINNQKEELGINGTLDTRLGILKKEFIDL